MEGVLFYWISWIFWVIITFIMKKRKLRTFLSYGILLAITCSNMFIIINSLSISLAVPIILIGGFILFSKVPHFYYHVFATLTLTIGYTSLLIWESQAPIWIIMPKNILFPVLLTFFICFLTKDYLNRLSIGIVGVCSGELLYSLMLMEYQIPYVIGEKSFLDILFIVFLILLIIECLQRLKQKVLESLKIYRQSLRWQNE